MPRETPAQLSDGKDQNRHGSYDDLWPGSTAWTAARQAQVESLSHHTFMEQNKRALKEKIKRLLRKDLGKYIADDGFVDPKTKRTISWPTVENPQFKNDWSKGSGGGGVSQGEGDIGTPIGKGDPTDGWGQAGSGPGEHDRDPGAILPELTEIMEEELYLPRLIPKTGVVETILEGGNYGGRAPQSPRMHVKESMKRGLIYAFDPKKNNAEEAILRGLTEFQVDKKWRPIEKEVRSAHARIVIIMDSSGSMNYQNIKDNIRALIFWTHHLLSRQYKKIEFVFMNHDDDKVEVTEDVEDFLTINMGGGTKISRAFARAQKEIVERQEEKYGNNTTIDNNYVLYFGDGDNQSNDNMACTELFKKFFSDPRIALRFFGMFKLKTDTTQMWSSPDDAEFYKAIRQAAAELPDDQNGEPFYNESDVVRRKDERWDAIKKVLGAKHDKNKKGPPPKRQFPQSRRR